MSFSLYIAKSTRWINSKLNKKRNCWYFINHLHWTLFPNSVHPDSPFACMNSRYGMLINQRGTGANPFGLWFVNLCFQVVPEARAEATPACCAPQMGHPSQRLATSGAWGLDFPFISWPGASVTFWGRIQSSRLNTHGQSRTCPGPGPLQQDQCWSQRICSPLWLWGTIGFIRLFTSYSLNLCGGSRQLYVSAMNAI